MKPIEGYNKLRGGYYTPEKISEFISQWAIRKKDDTVLEPSCGDGSFLGAIAERFKVLGASGDETRRNVIGVELYEEEAQKARFYGTTVITSDFFTFYKNEVDGKQEFDAILGNPPFIRYQNFEEAYRKIAFSLMEKNGFHPNRLTNIWLPFLILSCKALKPGGRVGMVIPAELFQVDYAAEARLFLSSYFKKLSIVTFKKLVFDDIQQEVILLLGEKDAEEEGIRVIELDDMQDLISQWHSCLDTVEVKRLDHSQDKWVKYYLTNEELTVLSRLNNDTRITSAENLYEVNVGLVSGENTFFVINEDTCEKYGLQDSVVPIISRSDQLKGLELTEKDFDSLVENGKKVLFFEPGNHPFEDLSEHEKRYILFGEQQGFNNNYKCRIRPHWYHVSYTWRADAFLIRQANLYPRMILNRKNALVTDTLHKVRFIDGVNGAEVVAAFLNSYTLALSETIGRSYGGGVLTFEPGEMRKMRIPMHCAEELNLEQMDLWQRNGEIEKILSYTDEILLRKGLGLTEYDISLLRGIWSKLRDRRLSRKKK